MEIWSQTHKTEHQKRAIRCYFTGNIEKVNYLGLYAIRQAPQWLPLQNELRERIIVLGRFFL